jgi:hypothetical protein
MYFAIFKSNLGRMVSDSYIGRKAQRKPATDQRARIRPVKSPFDHLDNGPRTELA